MGRQRRAPVALPPGKRPGTNFTGDRVGPRKGLDECCKSRPHRDSIPILPSPTTLSWPTRSRPIGNIQKSPLSAKVKFLKAEILYLTEYILIMLMMYCNNNLNGKYWVTFDPKLSGQPSVPDYRGATVYLTICNVGTYGV